LWIAPINRFVAIAAGRATFVANLPQCDGELPLQISGTQVVMPPSNIVDSIKAFYMALGQYRMLRKCFTKSM